MHELGILEEIFQIAQRELARRGVEGPVKNITLVVGKLSGASPEALRNAFEVVTPGTRWAGAELVIEEPGPVCGCSTCGFEEVVEELQLSCPRCGGEEITLSGGDELRLASLEMDDD